MIRHKGKGVTYGEIWYDEAVPTAPDVDILMCRHRAVPVDGARTVSMLSIISDLSVSADTLADSFDRDCRYKVRRADTKDGLSLEFTTEPAGRLPEFRAVYDALAAQKAVPSCDHTWLAAACAAGQLSLSVAVCNGEALVWHACVMSGSAVRLQHSASCFRSRENDYRALVGRANRWLHWQEMLRFKALGMTRYDWGGLFEEESDPECAGVNRFKKSFGGTPERSYECTVPVTVKGRAWLWLRDAWRRSPPSPAGAALSRPSVAA